MRSKKNREVNIFSASVVDLFASGLGVFLIVSIIALMNQKKETSKALEGDQSNPVLAEMQGEIEELSAKLEKLSDENFELKKKNLMNAKVTSKTEKEIEQKLEMAVAKSNFSRAEMKYKQEIEKLKQQVEIADTVISDLKESLNKEMKNAAEGKEGVATNFSEYEIGSKIQLENVHFYPGTDRSIEPYSTREIASFAKYMLENPAVTVEVSGHIYETKKAIESGKAEDIYNLSGRRARHVCKILEEQGVNPKRLNCVGYGASRPLHLTNDQFSESAQKNRRVEVEILSK